MSGDHTWSMSSSKPRTNHTSPMKPFAMCTSSSLDIQETTWGRHFLPATSEICLLDCSLAVGHKPQNFMSPNPCADQVPCSFSQKQLPNTSVFIIKLTRCLHLCRLLSQQNTSTRRHWAHIFVLQRNTATNLPSNTH